MASYLPIFVLVFLHLVLLPPYLATAANVPVPSSLSTNSNNSSWISSSGDFAFGFLPLNNSDLFLLAVWYNTIPETTIIWNANSDNPAPAGSTLELTQNGLSLNTPGGKSIWSAQPSGTVSHASMLDTGNFVLSSENSANVWETSKNLTVTILPTQKLDPGSKLFSRIAESNLSRVLLTSDNICVSSNVDKNIGSGVCGFNSYCRDQDGKPICECPPDFEPMGPNITVSGCRPTYYLGGCKEEASKGRDAKELYEMRRFENVDWPFGDYERLEPHNLTECEKSCLNDCLCAVAVQRLDDGIEKCWKKRFPLGNGIFKDGYATVLFKVRKGDSPSPFDDNSPPPFDDNRRRNKDKRVKLAGAILLGCSVLFNTILIIYIVAFLFRRKKKGGYKNIRDSNVAEKYSNLRIFSYEELEVITDGFKEELGRGSFGVVYKGVLGSDSKNTIAVKKLDMMARERERELKTEVAAIGRTHHKNLVQLLGFCDEGVNRLLVYEYMSNGTLADFLFSDPKPDWNMRVKIALEIAKGLVYLHEECSVPIIHCDIKPQNILLDDHFVAKISDFGLSKLLQPNQTGTRTIIRGTRGYVAPEWFKNVAVTAKVDVYSFGVMLLEIICCRRSVEMELEEEEKVILTDWVYDCYAEGRLDVLMENDEVAVIDKETAYRWLMVAIWCIQDDPSKRPTMKTVMQMLQGLVEVTKPPWPSSFSIMVLDQSAIQMMGISH